MSLIVTRVLDVLLLAPHLGAVLALGTLSVRLASCLRFLRLANRPGARGACTARVSVLVPARNEAASIAACVLSLLRQQYPDVEVIALDDGSTDGTGQELDALAARYPQLTVLHTTDDPPPGWNGKSFACHRLAERATGKWLLFTDADTLHAPTSIRQGVERALRLDAALLSAFPYQRTVTWSERLLVSFVMDFLPLVTLDLMAMWRGRRGTRTAANGQYLLADAASYRTVGGHACIASALVDDFALARHFQVNGYTVALVDGASMLSCRMYHSVGEVWNGFSKNLLGALTASSQKRSALWRAPAFAWFYACLFVIPFVNLAFSEQRALAGIEIAWLLLLRGIVVWRLRRPPAETLTTPLAGWGVMALGLFTLYRRWRRRRIVWKGRLYTS